MRSAPLLLLLAALCGVLDVTYALNTQKVPVRPAHALPAEVQQGTRLKSRARRPTKRAFVRGEHTHETLEEVRRILQRNNNKNTLASQQRRQRKQQKKQQQHAMLQAGDDGDGGDGGEQGDSTVDASVHHVTVTKTETEGVTTHTVTRTEQKSLDLDTDTIITSTITKSKTPFHQTVTSTTAIGPATKRVEEEGKEKEKAGEGEKEKEKEEEGKTYIVQREPEDELYPNANPAPPDDEPRPAAIPGEDESYTIVFVAPANPVPPPSLPRPSAEPHSGGPISFLSLHTVTSRRTSASTKGTLETWKSLANPEWAPRSGLPLMQRNFESVLQRAMLST